MRETVLIVAFLAVVVVVAALLNSPGTLAGAVLGLMFGAAVSARK